MSKMAVHSSLKTSAQLRVSLVETRIVIADAFALDIRFRQLTNEAVDSILPATVANTTCPVSA